MKSSDGISDGPFGIAATRRPLLFHRGLVPAVLVMKPFVTSLADPQRAWLVVAMASTLAGNFTLVGSVANLIVAQRARSRGVEIGFWIYFKVGAPLTVLTILFGIFWL